MEKFDNIDESNASYSTKFTRNPTNSQSDEFEVLNPLQFPTLSRCDANVVSRRNFIFEMDNEPLESQKKYISKNKGIINRWVFSGSKSIHMRITISHNPASIGEYKYIWKYLNDYYFDGKADRSCANPARLTRKLNGYRVDKRKKQVGEVLEKNVIDVSFLHDEYLIKQEQKKNSKKALEMVVDDDGKFKGQIYSSILETLLHIKNKESDRWKYAYKFATGVAEYSEGIEALGYLKWLGFSFEQIKNECEFGNWNFREEFYNKL